jgi:ABC-type polar amino acid transport system ATPase subunit
MLEAKNISYGYVADKPIIKNIDLTIAPGQITTLIGPSGTGKTTLLRCLALLDRPFSGSISVDDKKFDFPWPRAIEFEPPWPHLTTVFQQLFLWPHKTLRENILLPVRLRGISVEDFEKVVDVFEMREFIDRYPNEASLGQRQRAALARAVLLKPRYLLLDEITSALDVEQVAKILAFLKELKGRGIGIFIITHLLGFARQSSDQILFMADGTIVERGTPDILQNPKTERLSQFLSVVAAAS